MELVVGESQGARGEEGAASVEGRAGRHSTGSGVYGIAAWLMTLTNASRVVSEGAPTNHVCDGVFRKIMGFL